MDLVVSGVGHAYGPLPALEGINLHVASGEIVAVLGPSGCGKSTLLGIAGGLIAPGAGSVMLEGDKPPRCLNALTYVFQDFALLPGAMSQAMSRCRWSITAWAARRSRGASTRRWRGSACRSSAPPGRASSRAACASVSASPEPWLSSPRCC